MRPGPWSPDGARLAYVAYQGDQSVWVVDRDGKNLVKLVDGYGDIYELAWSPDGRTVAFTATPAKGTSGATGLYLADLTGSGAKAVAEPVLWSIAWTPSAKSESTSGGESTAQQLAYADPTKHAITFMSRNGKSSRAVSAPIRQISQIWIG